jgi:hypothetical protein
MISPTPPNTIGAVDGLYGTSLRSSEHLPPPLYPVGSAGTADPCPLYPPGESGATLKPVPRRAAAQPRSAPRYRRDEVQPNSHITGSQGNCQASFLSRTQPLSSGSLSHAVTVTAARSRSAVAIVTIELLERRTSLVTSAATAARSRSPAASVTIALWHRVLSASTRGGCMACEVRGSYTRVLAIAMYHWEYGSCCNACTAGCCVLHP